MDADFNSEEENLTLVYALLKAIQSVGFGACLFVSKKQNKTKLIFPLY